MAEDEWAKGVTDAQKKTAGDLLQQGNQRYVENDYKGALDKYREALKSWNHPAIRFNAVRCLIQLEDKVAAADELKESLKYGAAPFEDTVYREALVIQKVLEDAVGDFELKCEQAGVAVTLDGKKLWDCPHSEKLRLKSGQYQLVGQRDGYLTRTVKVVVVGNKVTQQTLELDPREKAARVVHRYPTWLPWTVFGAGAVVAGIGGLINVAASNQMDEYDSNVASQCAEHGCSKATDPGQYDLLKKQEDRALFYNKLAIGVIAAGAATAVVGGVMIFLNRGQTVYSESKGEAAPAAFNIVPTSDGAMGVLSGHF